MNAGRDRDDCDIGFYGPLFERAQELGRPRQKAEMGAGRCTLPAPDLQPSLPPPVPPPGVNGLPENGGGRGIWHAPPRSAPPSTSPLPIFLAGLF